MNKKKWFMAAVMIFCMLMSVSVFVSAECTEHRWDEGTATYITYGSDNHSIVGVYHCLNEGCTATDSRYRLEPHKYEITKYRSSTACEGIQYKCIDCGYLKFEEIEHKWDEGVIVGYHTGFTGHQAQKKFYCLNEGCKFTKNSFGVIEPHEYEVIQVSIYGTVKKCTKCRSTVKDATPKLTPTISLPSNSLILKTGQSTTAFKIGGFANGDRLSSVTSSNTKIVKPSIINTNGTIRLTAQKKTGTAKLKITLASGLTREVTVKVQKGVVKTNKITGVSKALTIKRGKAFALKPVLSPLTSQDKIRYSSSNKKIAAVSSKGVIKGIKPGKAKITVKAGSKKVICTVTVEGIKTTRITGVKTSLTLKKGKSVTLKPKRVPSNSTDALTYKSSNKKIVSVSSSGKIKGVKPGTATITVTSGKVSVKCKVTVNK